MSDIALELRDITKRFPGVVANDRVSLRVRPGTVHGLVGENGTGKTTLMRIAYGELQPDGGEVRIQGTPLGRGGTARAIALGLGMVHQHFMLVPTLRVAENVVLGREPRRGPWFDRGAARRRVLDTASRFGLQVDPDARVADLSVGEQQRVEIVKVLDRGARVLILDEPTSVLAPREVQELFGILRRLVDQGHCIVLISHRLQEVLALADVITVMRRGHVVGEVVSSEASEEHLARLIVGREVQSVTRRGEAPGSRADVEAEPVLRCQNVSTAGTRDALRDVTLEVRAGEVLGIAGVEGNGQRALTHALLGLEPLTGGTILLQGHDLSALGTAARRDRGMAYVPADRLREGLIEELRVDENLILGRQREPQLGRGPYLAVRRVSEFARALLRRFEVRPVVPEFPAAALSGGNQQRLVLAREMDRDPAVLVLAQPTRGVDIGGITFIHQRILAARDAGRAILLISADLTEILALSDRIAVLFEGRIVGTVASEAADAGRLGLWMTGGGEDVA